MIPNTFPLIQTRFIKVIVLKTLDDANEQFTSAQLVGLEMSVHVGFDALWCIFQAHVNKTFDNPI